MKPDWPFEQIFDPPLQDAFCRQTYGIFEPFGFEKLVDLGIRKAGVRHHESEPPSRAPIACRLPSGQPHGGIVASAYKPSAAEIGSRSDRGAE